MRMSSIATVMLCWVFIGWGAATAPRSVVQLACENRCAASLSCNSPLDCCSDQCLNHVSPFSIGDGRSGDPSPRAKP